MPSITNNEKRYIRSASQHAVLQTLVGMRPIIKRSLWLGRTNYYLKKTTKRSAAAPSTQLRQRQMAQYISVSSCLHVNDGWSYYGRAIGSILSGDSKRALHLAYYAELRATMALLASVGIGVFNSRHHLVSNPNAVFTFSTRVPTHKFAWLALNTWCGSRNSAGLVADIVQPEGIKLSQWLATIGGSTSLAPQARGWFLQWGMDLRVPEADHIARNESSYRPDGIPMTWQLPHDAALRLIEESWQALEPAASHSFGSIDRYLLRLTLEKSFLGRMGSTGSSSDPRFVTEVTGIVTAQGFVGSRRSQIIDFLLRKVDAADPCIFQYAGQRPSSAPSDVLGLISRALFLLRIATGSAHRLLHDAGLDALALAFWWEQVGLSRGLWAAGGSPALLADLWADVDAELSILSGTAGRSANLYDFLRQAATSASVLSSHERVGLWGLCPS